jgi:hypothetical protein
MTRLISPCLLAALLLLDISRLHAQQSDNPPPDNSPPVETAPETKPQQAPTRPLFFAGIVTVFDESHITVSRTLVGHEPETRTFLITKETKLGKTPKLKSRVTVRYRKETDGDTALEIQVHPQQRTHPA